jgi:Vacuolar-sorting associated protein 13, adaptor binding domain
MEFASFGVIARVCVGVVTLLCSDAEIVDKLKIYTHPHPHPHPHSHTHLSSLGPDWAWSGGFRLSEIVHFALKLINKRSGEMALIGVEVQLTGATYFVSFSPLPPEKVPYRLENRSSVPVEFRQKKTPDTRTPSELIRLSAYSSIPYAWEEPNNLHRLLVFAPQYNLKKDLNLDKIKSYFWLRGSSRQAGAWVEQKVAVRLVRELTERPPYPDEACLALRVKGTTWKAVTVIVQCSGWSRVHWNARV